MDANLKILCRNTKFTLIFSNQHPSLSRNVWGLCDLSSRQMLVRKSLRGTKAIDTLIHEFSHGYFPDLGEEAVDQFATQLVAAMKKCKMIDEAWNVKKLDSNE
jgi:hypothetical protein